MQENIKYKASSLTNLIKMFSRENTSKFKTTYNIGKNTHLIKVADAIKISNKLERDILKCKVTEDIDKESIKNKLNLVSGSDTEHLVYNLVYLETHNKTYIINSINKHIINNLNFENELTQHIKNQSDGLKYAIALGVLDDYIDFLETGIYKGPTTSVAV